MVNLNKILSFKVKRQAKNVFPSDVERTVVEVSTSPVTLGPSNTVYIGSKPNLTFGSETLQRLTCLCRVQKRWNKKSQKYNNAPCQVDNMGRPVLKVSHAECDKGRSAFRLYIMKPCLYNSDPLKPHFYIVKLGFTRVYIIFLIFLKNIDCRYSLELPRRGGSNEYPQSMFCAET